MRSNSPAEKAGENLLSTHYTHFIGKCKRLADFISFLYTACPQRGEAEQRANGIIREIGAEQCTIGSLQIIYILYVPPIPLQGGVARSARVVIGRNNGIWNHPTLRGTPPRRGMGNGVQNNHFPV